MNFKDTAFRTVQGKPLAIDEEVNLLINAGYSLHGKPYYQPDGDMVVTLVQRQVMAVDEGKRRFTPKASGPYPANNRVARGFDGR